MAKNGMDGSDGMSPRKSTAMGKTGMGGESFGVSGIEDHQHHGDMHPDARMDHNPLEDHERGIGLGIHHHENMHAAQAAPHHGHTHPHGHMKSEMHRHGKHMGRKK
jgi:hypothetical protein